jgi:hypothetical protein
MNRRTLVSRYVITLLFFVIAAVLIVLVSLRRTELSHPKKFGIGRPARPDDIKALDIDVMPDGRGLPVGSGSVEPGRLIYNSKCAACHGNGEKTESPLPGEPLFVAYATDEPSNKNHKALAGKRDKTPKTIGTYWPYATTIFDYVRRAMPYNAPGSLTDQEVYHLTAYLLYRNRIIPAQTVINERSLPKIVMPAKKMYVEDDREGGKELK